MRTYLPLLVALVCTRYAVAQGVSLPDFSGAPGSSARTVAQPPANAAPVQGSEGLTSFDPRAADLRMVDGKWQLHSSGIPIKDFDQREAEAREALRIVRELHLTHYGTVGKPRPVMEYWLSNGQAPKQLVGGLRLLPFDPMGARLEQAGGQWCMRLSPMLYFAFGSHADEAQQALEVVRRYGFNQIGCVGQPVPIMLIFLSTAGPAQATPPTVPSSLKAAAPALQNPQQTPTTKSGGPSLSTSAGFIRPNQPPGLPSLLPDLAVLQERLPIDWHQARVRQVDQEWKVMLGNQTLASYGKSQRQAESALAVIQHYRFTEICSIGKTNPSFTFFLVRGQAPRGLMLGVSSVAFRPDQLRVQQVGGVHILTDGSQMLHNFGAKAEDAHQALEAVKRYKCDHLCRTGTPDAPGFTFLVRTAN